MSTSKSGQCFCGVVKVTVESEPLTGYRFCFCKDCLQLSGGVGQLTAGWYKNQVKIEDPENVLKVLKLPDTGSGYAKWNQFCTNCSITVATTTDSNDKIIVLRPTGLNLGNLDDLKPDHSVHCHDRCNWIGDLVSLQDKV